MRKQSLLIVILVIVIISLFVGYRTIMVSSNVSSKTTEAENVNVTFSKIGSITEVNSEEATAVISDDGKTVTINVPKLFSKGAYVEIPITIKNNGAFSAKLYSISESGINQDAPIVASYRGIGVTDAPILPGGEANFVVKVAWEKDLNETIKSVDLSIKFNYVQG